MADVERERERKDAGDRTALGRTVTPTEGTTDSAPSTDKGTGTRHGVTVAGHESPAGVGGETVRGRDARSTTGSPSHGVRLLPGDECDKLTTRLQHAVAGFVDGPRTAVEEADHVLEEAAARFTEAVKERRRTLRTSWQGDGGAGKSGVSDGDTEQLRLALRDYRELAERLLHI
ncbi:hypothetical protein ABZ896_01250 [Streptomyces sp. NPDC047072]|uniref:hypothetical protein n=1 Tax=Streptomyces sp. NPDC047072 TaxID=3154809 RepID=UPI0033FF41F3